MTHPYYEEVAKTIDAFVQEMLDLGANDIVDACNDWYLSK